MNTTSNNTKPKLLFKRAASAIWRKRMAIVSTVLVLFVIHGVASVFLSWQVDREIQKLRSQGKPLDAADLVLPTVSDSQNGAILYEKAIKILGSNEYQSNERVIDDLLNPALPRNNETTWTKAAQVTKQFRELTSLAQQAQMRPKCRFNVKWENWPDVTQRHYTSLRDLARFITAEALVNARAGNPERATKLIMTVYGIGESIKNEPTLMNQLHRYAILSLATSGLEDVLNLCDPSQDQCKTLYEYISKIELDRGLTKSVEELRVEGLQVYDYAFNESSILYSLFSSEGGWAKWRLKLITSSLGRPFLYADELAYLQSVNRMALHSKMPYTSIKYLKVESSSIPWYAIIAKTLEVPTLPLARDIKKARIVQAQTALILATYKSRFGSYPATLTEILQKRQMWWEWPHDPFSNELKYRREGEGFVIYSIGPDLKDNHGKERRPNKQGEDVGDIVFRRSR